ncbi:MAG: 2-dehydropantoate 2-reductase [Verrucomicrobia bacterium]|nr:2-dehydropantoate 2-reductase [Verrucomicrobiota bacterium]
MPVGSTIELPPHPSVAVVGSGALGTYYGAKLARLGLRVSFLARRDLHHLQQHGLKIRCTDGNFELKTVRALARPEEIGPVDLVVVAIKTTANGSLRTLLPPLLGSNTVVCTLQNGLGNEEFLASIAGRERILSGVCHVCVSRPEPGVALNMSGGNIRFSDLSGGDTPRARSLAALFEKAGIRCSVAPSVGSARWYKLVWNVPFNGLSITAGGIDTAKILADPKLHRQTLDLMQEVMSASAALGFPQDADHPDKEIARTRKMGAYQPSSLLDYLAGKPVELESIWGEAYRQGTAAGVPMPHLQALYEKLKTMVKV